jgi:hypothetical protein
LGDEQAVERVPMVERQADQLGGVPRFDGQDGEAVVENGMLDEVRKRFGEDQFCPCRS